MNERSVCFTGHRNVKMSQELILRLNKTLTNLIENGATDFYVGGALGWDTLCEQAVIDLRKKFPQIKLHLILPCSPEEQTARWEHSQKEEYYKYLKNADTVEYTSDHYYDGCMKVRNARLVDLADCCVCYYDNRSRSGTGQTIRMAKGKGIRIINLTPI